MFSMTNNLVINQVAKNNFSCSVYRRINNSIANILFLKKSWFQLSQNQNFDFLELPFNHYEEI
jgi:hypothetical protein